MEYVEACVKKDGKNWGIMDSTAKCANGSAITRVTVPRKPRPRHGNMEGATEKKGLEEEECILESVMD